MKGKRGRYSKCKHCTTCNADFTTCRGYEKHLETRSHQMAEFKAIGDVPNEDTANLSMSQLENVKVLSDI